MRTFRGLTLVLVLIPALAGCDAVSAILSANGVTVELVNNADFDVEAKMFYHDDQDVIESLLEVVGTEVNLTVQPGQSTTFSRDCDDFQAFFVENAELRVIAAIGPEANTGVLRDGDEFSCGDTIVLTFDHSNALLDFDVAVSYR
jgi:hypothetical protein